MNIRMNFDGLVTAGVVDELRHVLIGGRIQHVRQHNDSDFTLEIRTPGNTRELFISVDARYTRIHLSTTKRLSIPQPPNFCMVARKHLGGCFITNIRQHGFDRIIFFDLEGGEHIKRTLVLELMGKHSNAIIYDENSIILGSIKNIGRSLSRVREILPGRTYKLPPGSERLDIKETGPELFRRLWLDELSDPALAEDARGWMMGAFGGCGPFLIRELIPNNDGDMVSESQVSEKFQLLRNIVLENSYTPVTIVQDNRSVMVYPISPKQAQFIEHPESSLSLALETLYNTLVTRSQLEDTRTQLAQMVKRSAEHMRSQLQSAEKTLKESAKADRQKEIGELLNGSAHLITKGAANIELVDYYDPEMKSVVIELDPKLSPRENADAYFRRYRKLKDSIETATKRKDISTEKLYRLDEARLAVDCAVSVDELTRIRRELESADLLRAIARQEEKPGKDEFDGYHIRRITTPDGWEILYGENSTSNDYLTQRIAKPNDIWLHARSITGAHVVIRTAGHSGQIPRSVLLEAARIAAANSDAKHSSLVPIDHTLRKYVRKPRGAVAGFVTYRMEKTIDIQPT